MHEPISLGEGQCFYEPLKVPKVNPEVLHRLCTSTGLPQGICLGRDMSDNYRIP